MITTNKTYAIEELHKRPILPSGEVRVTTEKTTYSQDIAVQAIVIPVHNAAAHVKQMLRQIESTISRNTELVIVLDDCNDASPEVVREWRSEVASSRIVSVTIAMPSVPVFETVSDVIGVALTSAPTIIEVQADIFIEEQAFDAAMHQVLYNNPEVAIVGGRGIHRFADAVPATRGRLARLARDAVTAAFTRYHFLVGSYRPSRLEFRLTGRVGRLGSRVEIPMRREETRRIFLGDTVMRGPYMFGRGVYESLGGLDTERFFLGLDDHDFAARAWKQLSLQAAYVPISFHSPLDLGATRAERTESQVREMKRLASQASSKLKESALAGQIKSATKGPPRRVRVLRDLITRTTTT